MGCFLVKLERSHLLVASSCIVAVAWPHFWSTVNIYTINTYFYLTCPATCWIVSSVAASRLLRDMIVVLLLCVEFRELSHLTSDLSQAEKKINVVTSWVNAQNDSYFTQNGRSCHFEWKYVVVILWVAQLVTTLIFFSAWDKSRNKWDNSRNLTQKMRTHID